MTALQDILMRQIASQGPITLADYMSTCLMHPQHGYYATRDPFGAGGDFTTAPEISQMFGELLGLALAQAWMDQGSPARFVLAELGPGRGTLMADILRATRSVPGFLDAADIVLVEASAHLRQVQRTTLSGHTVTWADTAEDFPQAPLFIVANEFFDALPIRQFVRDGAGWRERMVGLGNGALSFGLSAATLRPELAHRLDDTKDGDIVETCAAASAICRTVGERIAQHGGAAIVIDYGDWRSLGDTFQAFRTHTPIDPLATPGQADLTAHVDFEALATVAPCAHSRLTPQGLLLERLGITTRAQALAKQLSGLALDTHVDAHRRLTHPQEMGNLFKALALFPEGAAPPPGFAT